MRVITTIGYGFDAGNDQNILVECDSNGEYRDRYEKSKDFRVISGGSVYNDTIVNCICIRQSVVSIGFQAFALSSEKLKVKQHWDDILQDEAKKLGLNVKINWFLCCSLFES